MRKGWKRGQANRPQYYGKPCRRCGGTLRYHADRKCVSCLDAQRPNRDLLMRRTYGISAADFAGIVRRQGGRCVICQRPRELVPDHDHATGKFRGAVCQGCNAGLGLLGDTEAGIGRALDYLRKRGIEIA